MLTLVTESPVPGVFGWSSPGPTDASSERVGVPPLQQLVGISVPAPTQGLNWGGLVRGAEQARQLSPSSRGLASRGMWQPLGVGGAPFPWRGAPWSGLHGAVSQSPGTDLSRSVPKLVALKKAAVPPPAEPVDARQGSSMSTAQVLQPLSLQFS